MYISLELSRTKSLSLLLLLVLLSSCMISETAFMLTGFGGGGRVHHPMTPVFFFHIQIIGVRLKGEKYIFSPSFTKSRSELQSILFLQQEVLNIVVFNALRICVWTSCYRKEIEVQRSISLGFFIFLLVFR